MKIHFRKISVFERLLQMETIPRDNASHPHHPSHDEQLPTLYAVVRGVRRDADGVYRVKVKWLKMREHTNVELAEELFHEVDDDEEETDQELETFSHSAQRSLGA
ncbi:hypothetical protein PPROV_001119200 [Pycnococcus provasolii]|uniref:Uncharacterized protein n=1 Tax=Pycnococcus provasolii TaxID=41880 RepID=A0A830HZB7_9CHLO|nr:hypothetical protein PPROV_001119200 [Pycnococcus provasolii]|mmetsp:Transcript_1101/g.2427  ORF Transcript_1101/g.2427 Transcript_1101/m.2427 type:complete len:105 (+) Transcript_1101:2047-2361(+)